MPDVFVITGLDPVIHPGFRRRSQQRQAPGMAGSSPAMTTSVSVIEELDQANDRKPVL
jgi:hypothetical protein